MAFGKAPPMAYRDANNRLQRSPSNGRNSGSSTRVAAKQVGSRAVSPGMAAVQSAGKSEKSLFIAYVFWFFTAGFGGHRMYCGRVKSGLLQFLSVLLVVGIIWVFVDLFLMPRLVREANARR